MPLIYRPHAQHSSQSVKLEAPHEDCEPSSQSSSSAFVKEEQKEVNEGRWQDGENLKFAVFLAYYQGIFASRHKRKQSKIFKSLAEYLVDRTAPQCRSHFQKLLVKYRTAAKIKKHFRDTFGEGIFDLALERFKTQWEQNHVPVRRSALGVREFREVAVQTEEIVLKEEPSFQGSNEGLHVHAFAWGMPKMEHYHPYYYLKH